MIRVGIICDLSYTRHLLFKYYYHAIENLYGKPTIVVSNDQLDDIEILFIGDDHYHVNKATWQQEGFIDKCNEKDIKVVVFTNEKILNSYFLWNADNLTELKKIKNLYHYTSDVDDCIALGTKLHRTAMSKTYKDIVKVDVKNKLDGIVFFGATECIMDSYQKRKECLIKLNELIGINVIDVNNPRREFYFQTISEFRFVLSPVGNGNFFSMRVYETLAVKSIPIVQVQDNTLDYYDIEAKFPDCIFFKDPEELKEKIDSFTLQTSYSELWLEDYLSVILKEDGLL